MGPFSSPRSAIIAMVVYGLGLTVVAAGCDAITAPTPNSPPLLKEGDFRDRDQCRKQPDLLWCQVQCSDRGGDWC